MRKIFILISFGIFLAGYSGKAQIFTIAYDTVIINANGLNATYHDNITIPGTGSVTIKWQVDTALSDFPADWITNGGGGSTSLCDNAGCYPSSIITSGALETAYYTDTTPDFHMNICLLGATTIGTHHITVKFSTIGQTSYETFMVTNALSVPALTHTSDLIVYPNPVGSSINLLSANGMPIGRAAIYDCLGNLVMEQECSGNKAVMFTEGLVSGMYIINIFGVDGEVLTHHRFYKQ